MKRTTRFAALLTLLSVQAYGSSTYNFSDTMENDHLLSVGEGISSPSTISALGENPAGLVYNRTFKVLGELSSGNDQFSPLGYGGGFLAGNGSVGGGIVLNGSNSTANGVAASIDTLQFGIAAEFPSINLAWGFTGSFAFSGSGPTPTVGYGNSSWGLDTGVIFNPRSQTRFGITLFDVLDGIDAFAGGVSYDPTPWATFALDANYSKGPQTTVVKPGLAIHLPGFQLAAGYGARVVGDGTGWFPTGLSLGVGFPISRTFALQAYYNQLALYYAGLTISL